MNDQLLTDVNAKLDRLLSILDGPTEEDEALYIYCVKQFVRGNKRPLDAYHNRGGKILNIDLEKHGLSRGKARR